MLTFDCPCSNKCLFIIISELYPANDLMGMQMTELDKKFSQENVNTTIPTQQGNSKRVAKSRTKDSMKMPQTQ